MKRHTALLVLMVVFVSGPGLAQQRSDAPPAQDQLREAVKLLQRAQRPNMNRDEITSILRELERALSKMEANQPGLRLQAAAGDGTGLQPNPDLVGEIRLILAPVDGDPAPGRAVVRVSRSEATAWWTNTALVARLGLTDDQKARIERAFDASRHNLETSKAQLEKEEAQLDKLLAADSLDRAGIVTQISRVIQARGEMERTNSLMTLEMRTVLTPAQWAQLQAQTNTEMYVFRTPAGLAVPPGQPGARGGGQRGPAPAAPKQ